MTPISARRAAWLRHVHELGRRLRRAPYPNEIASSLGTTRRVGTGRVSKALADGHIVVSPRPSAFCARSVRVAPLAMLELGLPAVVYLAWPLPGPSAPHDHHVAALEAGRAAAGWLADSLRVVTVSPYLIGSARLVAGTLGVAASIAERSDAVVVWRDPLLVGRQDVAAATAAGVPVSVLTADLLVTDPGQLWRPPILQPTYAQR